MLAADFHPNGVHLATASDDHTGEKEEEREEAWLCDERSIAVRFLC